MRAPRLTIGLGLILAVLFGCSDERLGDIVLITVDTLRPDHLGIYGYPRNTSPELDRWFSNAAVFERAYSTEANTSPSVASILSGLLPQEHRVRLLFQLLPDDIQIVPDLLPDSYVSAAFVSNTVLSDESMGMAHRFDHYDDFMTYSVGTRFRVYERRAEETTNAVLKWLHTDYDPDRPLFLWIHYIDPHSPYDAPLDARPRFEKPSPHTLPEHAPSTPSPPAGDLMSEFAKIDRYDEEIYYVDREIGRLLSGIERQMSVDQALIALTADHGESMLEHEAWFTHGYQVYDEIVRVPLMLRGPGVIPGRRTELASGVDLMRTILAFAGEEVSGSTRAVDLRERKLPDDRAVFVEAAFASHWRGVVQGAGKWILELPRGEAKVVSQRYYDLEGDPEERTAKTPLPDSGALRHLKELVARDPDPGGVPQDSKRGIRLTAPKVAPRATEEQLDRLRALGYAE